MMDFESVENALYAIREEKYVVLRNFEDFGKKSFLTNHPDIDLLCEDVTAVVQCLHAIPRAKSDDKVHYYVLIGGNKVPVDIRRPGDGYYCETWEKDILAKRVKKDKYYVMDSENYFFSLLYHARIQKASFSNDYINRLIELGRRIGVEFSEIHSVPILEKYLREKGYLYTYPENPQTVFNITGVSGDLIENNNTRKLRRKMAGVIKKVKILLGG